jgi:hypothetical protein
MCIMISNLTTNLGDLGFSGILLLGVAFPGNQGRFRSLLAIVGIGGILSIVNPFSSEPLQNRSAGRGQTGCQESLSSYRIC